MWRYVFCEGATRKVKIPSLSVVAVITLPAGLIKTIVAFGIPTLFASRRCPVILTVERSRAATFFIASSDVGSAAVGDGAGSGVGVASGFGASVGFGVSAAGVGAGVASVVGVASGAAMETTATGARRSSRPFVAPLMLR